MVRFEDHCVVSNFQPSTVLHEGKKSTLFILRWNDKNGYTGTIRDLDNPEGNFRQVSIVKYLSHVFSYRVCHRFRLTRRDDCFGPIFTTFESNRIFGGSWGSVDNWLELKTEPRQGNLACRNP